MSLERNVVLHQHDALGQLIRPHVFERTSLGGGQVRYRLSLFDPAADGSFDLGNLVRPVAGSPRRGRRPPTRSSRARGGRCCRSATCRCPVNIASVPTQRSRFGVGLDIPAGEQFVLFDSSDVRLSLEVVDDWLADLHRRSRRTAAAGSSCSSSGCRPPGSPRSRPVVIAGLGAPDRHAGRRQADRPRGDHPLGRRARLPGQGLRRARPSASAAISSSTSSASRSATAGGNPVASNFMRRRRAGDPASASPGVLARRSPVVSKPAAPVEVDVRAGEGDGPWWLPIQRAFGPLYVEQVGSASARRSGDVDSVSLLIDGGASLAGLTVAGRRPRAVIIPWATPLEPSHLAARPRRHRRRLLGQRPDGRRRAAQARPQRHCPTTSACSRSRSRRTALTAVGGYGVFPDGAGGEYTSFFVFGAVTAPIGGPPAFFVTGLGGGIGVNRRLIAPDDIAAGPDFPLVAGARPGSRWPQDPMGALEPAGRHVPARARRDLVRRRAALHQLRARRRRRPSSPSRSTTGSRSTSSAWPAWRCPTPAPPMAQVELALQARFSTREGVLSVQAQLTDNSWLLNESLPAHRRLRLRHLVRRGRPVRAHLGGYHPDFASRRTYPVVPRLGFAWAAVELRRLDQGRRLLRAHGDVRDGRRRAGGVVQELRLVWASLEVGVDVLVSWDPFFYDFKAYVRISAGIDIEVCFFVCGRMRFSFSFGAEVHISGPKLRGSVKLDLDLIVGDRSRSDRPGRRTPPTPCRSPRSATSTCARATTAATCWRRRSPRVRSRRRPRRPDRAPARASRARPTTARPAGRGRSRRSSRSSCRPAPPPTR